MKKFALLLLITPFFISCSSDDDKDSISLKESEKSLSFGDKYQIVAESDSKIAYATENEYHATVDEDGLVLGGRVGETNIILSNKNEVKKVRITINPKSNLYPAPSLDFGITKEQIKAKYGTPDSETETGLGYTEYSDKAPVVMYLFENNKLQSSAVMVKTAYSSQLGTHLGERFLPIASEDYTIFFINALSIDKTTMLVGSNLYNTNYWMVLYMPNSQTRSASNSTANLKAIDELMNSMQ